MFRKLTLSVMTVTAAALLAMAPGFADAQTAGAQQDQQGHMQGNMNGSKKMMGTAESGAKMDCQSMQASMKEMQIKRQQMQATLDELAAKVKATHGAKQQAAMAELLTTMIDQQRAMTDMMSKMQTMMMNRMTNDKQPDGTRQNTASGGTSGGSMMNGSMMKGSGTGDGHASTSSGTGR